MYVVTGATGHTGRVVAKALLEKGAKVRVLGRNPKLLESLASQGAEPLVVDLTDRAAITDALGGAKGAYLMLPPKLVSPDYRAFQNRVADAIAAAVKAAGVSYVVTLSSMGADKADKTGPIIGLHYLEQQLNAIAGLNALHLRAGYFMENTLAQIAVVQKFGVAVGPLRPDLKLPMIASRDIGAVAADALVALDFEQKQTRELLGQRDISMDEVAEIIGRAMGRAELGYIQAADDEIRPALIQTGMSLNMADLILEMSAALNSGYMRALEARSETNTTPTSYEIFVREELVPLYQSESAAA